MGRSEITRRLLRSIIGLVGLCTVAVALPHAGFAVVARPCETEPTDETIRYDDFISCAISPVGDSDTFRFSGLAGEKAIIQAIRTGGGALPCLELTGPTGTRIAADCGTGIANRIDIVLAQAGTHAIRVNARFNDAVGTYNLTLLRIAPLTRFGTPIRYGETLSGLTIGLTGELPLLVLSGTKGNRISIETTRTAGGALPCIELFAPDGVRLAADCGTGNSNRIDATLTQDGTHTVLVEARFLEATGTYSATLQCIVGTCTDAIPTSLEAVVSPPRIAVPVGTPAIASATITNTGSAADVDDDDRAADTGGPDALSCGIVQLTGVPAQFSFQASDPATSQPVGPPNTPVNIQPGANQSFTISLTPTAELCPTDVRFGFSCSNAGLANVLTGVNTLVLTAGAPACGLSTSASVSQPAFAVGQTLIAGVSATNPGLAGVAADVYIGILRPDGSIHFVTSTGIAVGNVANLGSFQPIALNVPLTAPFSVSEPSVFTHQRTAGDLPGPHVFFIAAVKAGALAGGTLANDQILSVATAPYSFP